MRLNKILPITKLIPLFALLLAILLAPIAAQAQVNNLTSQGVGLHAFAMTTKLTGSYKLDPTYYHNPNERQVQIKNFSSGLYEARFEGLAGAGGNVQVSSYGNSATRCQVQSWNSSGTDLVIRVGCHNSIGIPTNSLFVVSYMRVGAKQGYPGLAYVWSGESSSNPPSSQYQYNSSGGPSTVARIGLGQYRVLLPGQSQPGGTVSVTAYGSSGEYCSVGGWSKNGNDTTVNVNCFSASGSAQDALFSLRYQYIASKFAGDSYVYAWANEPKSPDYLPSNQYQASSVSSTPVKSTRQTIGRYTMNLPGVLPNRATVVVSAYGRTATYCKPVSWGGISTGVQVSIACTDARGTPVDSQFTLSFYNGPSRYRILTEEPGQSGVNISNWEGYLTLQHPTDAAKLETIRVKLQNGIFSDVWYRNSDRSLSKVVVDRSRTERGVLTIMPDRSMVLSLDLNGDRFADIVEMSFANGYRRILATEELGRESLLGWLNGRNPLCSGTGSMSLLATDIASAQLPGCGMNSPEVQAALGQAGQIDPEYGADGWLDPLDALCAGKFSPRPPQFRGGSREIDLVGPTAEIIKEVLNNGFDGVRDSDAEIAARAIVSPLVVGYALLQAYYAQSIWPPDILAGACRAQGCNERGVSTDTQPPAPEPSDTDTSGSDSGTNPPPNTPVTDGGNRERPADGSSTTSEMLLSACKQRRQGNSKVTDQIKTALAPTCDDPNTFGGTMACQRLSNPSPVNVLRPEVASAIQCNAGNASFCEPTSVADRLQWLKIGSLLEIDRVRCDPKVCRPIQ